MNKSDVFLAARLGCLALAAAAFAAPQTFRGNKEMAQCKRLLKTFSDTGDWPDAAAPGYIRYDECYYLICGGTKPAA